MEGCHYIRWEGKAVAVVAAAEAVVAAAVTEEEEEEEEKHRLDDGQHVRGR